MSNQPMISVVCIRRNNLRFRSNTLVRNNSPHHRPILPTQSHASRCFARLRGAQCATLIRRPWRRLFSAMVRMSFSASFLHNEHSLDAVLARDLTENDTEASQSTPHTALRPRRQAGTIPHVTRAYLRETLNKPRIFEVVSVLPGSCKRSDSVFVDPSPGSAARP